MILISIKAFGQKDIFVLKSELPELEENEAYWFELKGMQVINLEGRASWPGSRGK